MRERKVEFWAGPHDGMERRQADLPDVIMIPYAPNGVAQGMVRYERVKDGRANPWRYAYVPTQP